MQRLTMSVTTPALAYTASWLLPDTTFCVYLLDTPANRRVFTTQRYKNADVMTCIQLLNISRFDFFKIKAYVLESTSQTLC